MRRANQECCLFIKAVFSAGSSASLPGQQLRLFFPSCRYSTAAPQTSLCRTSLWTPTTFASPGSPSLPASESWEGLGIPGLWWDLGWVFPAPGNPIPSFPSFLCRENLGETGEILSPVLEILV